MRAKCAVALKKTSQHKSGFDSKNYLCVEVHNTGSKIKYRAHSKIQLTGARVNVLLWLEARTLSFHSHYFALNICFFLVELSNSIDWHKQVVFTQQI